MMKLLNWKMLFLVLCCTGIGQLQRSNAQEQTLNRGELGTKFEQARQAMVLGFEHDRLVIEGTKSFDNHTITAKQLVFKPNAKLVFSQEARNRRNSFLIIAEEILVEDQANPGTIIWEAKPLGEVPGASGQGRSGSNGGDRSGSSGAAGETGPSGRDGKDGAAAPQLTIFVRKIPQSGPSIEFRGQSGGSGGKGGKGGTGGKGGSGRPASQSPFDCRRGAGDGGRGGDGGKGGMGGQGGDGGNGATVTIVSLADSLQAITNRLRVQVGGGEPGNGGEGGAGGDGGEGGAGGQEARPYCRGNGDKGSNGAKGPAGSAGNRGDAGLAGDVFVGSLTEEQLQRVFDGGL